MNKSIKRGQLYLESPTPEAKVYKEPLTLYVHYDSMGGERLAFAMPASTRTEWRHVEAAQRPYNIVDYRVSDELEVGARLVTLPTQQPVEVTQLRLAA